ncbi:serine/threonine protein kinase [Isosphaera pallida ATCC 43644]|uniref:Serine/threonine protein kinase n=1 Tax=Isosphaera pallida (strain ATCC 43644 / DSM 9630 / IS1B) TaxID=575540 RepID=E8R4D7_ISOPI|nr:bifunctional serine/threonine-protein kinase/formylglycine-generating enzyme family protein [Isosphaera pallida]ADV62738.1 serine/threonine protein kinase [Isosphaera pallida ATCC 43644]
MMMDAAEAKRTIAALPHPGEVPPRSGLGMTCDELVESLERLGLAPGGAARAAWEDVRIRLASSRLREEAGTDSDLPPAHTDPSDDPLEATLRELQRRGWLTPYQARLIVEGRMSELALDDYIILDELGRGGMGRVYKAQHRLMKRVVALKTLYSNLFESELAVRRFLTEVEALSRIQHPNVVTAFDARRHGESFYLVMEYVDGINLQDLVKSQGPRRAPQAVHFLLQAARGLDQAHQLGIIHRDVKPGNLLVNREGVVKILDLGLARMTQNASGTMTHPSTSHLGTPDYSAPEQFSDPRGVDERSDVYSLGCTLYYLTTGLHPYGDRETVMLKMYAHCSAPIPSIRAVSPGAPAALDELLKTMMAKDPADRPPSMAALIPRLEAILDELSATDTGVRPLLSSGSGESAAIGTLGTGGEGAAVGGGVVGGGFKSAASSGIVRALSSQTPPRKPRTERPTSPATASQATSSGGGGGPSSPRTPPKLETRTNSLGQTLARVEPRMFTFGACPTDRQAQPEEKPPHPILILQPFEVAQTPVTQAQFRHVMGSDPVPSGLRCDEAPVVGVTWWDAVEFCNALSRIEGLTPFYTFTEDGRCRIMDFSANGYRLPTEAEWEFVARAGRQTIYIWGGSPEPALADAHCWHAGNTASDPRPHPVGHKAPNLWSLFDLCGNTWEWCWDLFDPTWFARRAADRAYHDTGGPRQGTHRVTRGGSFRSLMDDLRLSRREPRDPNNAFDDVGFRVVRNLGT